MPTLDKMIEDRKHLTNLEKDMATLQIMSENKRMRQLTIEEMLNIEPPIVNPCTELKPLTKGFQLQYEHPHGQLYQGDSIEWLSSLESQSVDLIFADPPYNINKADWDNFENQEDFKTRAAWLIH